MIGKAHNIHCDMAYHSEYYELFLHRCLTLWLGLSPYIGGRCVCVLHFGSVFLVYQGPVCVCALENGDDPDDPDS